MGKKSSNKQVSTTATILVITVGFLVIYLFTSWNLFLYAALGVSSFGLFEPTSRLIHHLWMGLATVLSRIIPNILLTLIFFLILFPLALISKIGNKDPLMLSPDHKSYWVHDKGVPSKESFEKTW